MAYSTSSGSTSVFASRRRSVSRVMRLSACGKRAQQVSESAHRDDLRAVSLQLAAQAMNVDLDGLVADVLVELGERLGELLLGNDATGVFHEPAQHVQLARGEGDGASLGEHLHAVGEQSQVADGDVL